MGVKRIKELADVLSDKHDLAKDKAQDIVKDLFEEIKQSVGNGDKVMISNFATIQMKRRKPRKARNPRTGDLVFVPGKNAVQFKASKGFKDFLQVAGRNVLVFTKDTGNFRDFLVDNIKKIPCNPRIASTVEEAFTIVFDEDIEVYSILIDSTISDNEVRMVCNRVKMDVTENIISIIRVKQEGALSNKELLEILPDEIVCEPFEVEELMGCLNDEVNRIADEKGYFSQQVRMRVPTIIGEIEKTYEIMEDLFAKTNLEEEQIDELGHAYREAIGNAAIHGNNNDQEKDIFIDFVVGSKKISLSIEDQGEGFDCTPFTRRAEDSVALDVARARNKLDNPGGMGMMIIAKCADEVSYNSKGTKITITKHLNI